MLIATPAFQQREAFRVHSVPEACIGDSTKRTVDPAAAHTACPVITAATIGALTPNSLGYALFPTLSLYSSTLTPGNPGGCADTIATHLRGLGTFAHAHGLRQLIYVFMWSVLPTDVAGVASDGYARLAFTSGYGG